MPSARNSPLFPYHPTTVLSYFAYLELYLCHLPIRLINEDWIIGNTATVGSDKELNNMVVLLRNILCIFMKEIIRNLQDNSRKIFLITYTFPI